MANVTWWKTLELIFSWSALSLLPVLRPCGNTQCKTSSWECECLSKCCNSKEKVCIHPMQGPWMSANFMRRLCDRIFHFAWFSHDKPNTFKLSFHCKKFQQTKMIVPHTQFSVKWTLDWKEPSNICGGLHVCSETAIHFSVWVDNLRREWLSLAQRLLSLPSACPWKHVPHPVFSADTWAGITPKWTNNCFAFQWNVGPQTLSHFKWHNKHCLAL